MLLFANFLKNKIPDLYRFHARNLAILEVTCGYVRACGTVGTSPAYARRFQLWSTNVNVTAIQEAGIGQVCHVSDVIVPIVELRNK